MLDSRSDSRGLDWRALFKLRYRCGAEGRYSEPGLDVIPLLILPPAPTHPKARVTSNASPRLSM